MKPKDMGKDHKHMMPNMPPKGHGPGMMNSGKKAAPKRKKR